MVSKAQLDDDGLSFLPSLRIGGLTYLNLTVGSIRWHWSSLTAGSQPLPQPPEACILFWIASIPNSTVNSLRPIQHLHLLASILGRTGICSVDFGEVLL